MTTRYPRSGGGEPRPTETRSAGPAGAVPAAPTTLHGAGLPESPGRQARRPALPSGPLLPWLVALSAAAALLLVSGLSVIHLPLSPVPPAYHPDVPSWLQGWVRWDAGWYHDIATEGYTYPGPHVQTPVPFFPAYPLLMRSVAWGVGHTLLTGIAITLLSGLLAVVGFHRWVVDRLGKAAADTAVLVLVVYPFSYYLFGAVYADALFVLAAITSFRFLERGSPWLAGLAGAIATAARPVGLALVLGLAIRAWELRREQRGAGNGRQRAVWPVLLSVVGVAAYSGFLWSRFGEPLAFVEAAEAPGWGRSLGLSTVLHFRVAYLAIHPALDVEHLRVMVQALATVGALALVPVVVRRLGWGYGIYALAVVGVPSLTSLDLVGMGRYILAAFPCFAVAGDLLAAPRRRRTRAVLLVGSGALLVLMTSLFARGYYLS